MKKIQKVLFSKIELLISLLLISEIFLFPETEILYSSENGKLEDGWTGDHVTIQKGYTLSQKHKFPMKLGSIQEIKNFPLKKC